MTDFERELVNAFNNFFEEEGINGIAHRKKQHRFSSQLCDVLVDSEHEMFYLAIENKSVKTSSTNKLYFSQHFSVSDNGHQVERITDFLRRSGRKGFLAVELKRGRGRSRKAYMVPWDAILEAYEAGETGLHLDEIKQYPEIFRDSEHYSVEQLATAMQL
ncbi:MAG: hypothetical protein ABEJ75_00920 [Candidatus Nanohaloarchaea archaeon]